MKVVMVRHDKAGTQRHVPKNESHRMAMQSHHRQMPQAILQLPARKVLVNRFLQKHVKELPLNVSFNS